jgi:hypothetical protein
VHQVALHRLYFCAFGPAAKKDNHVLPLTFAQRLRSHKGIGQLWGDPIHTGHDPNPFFGKNQPQHQGNSDIEELSFPKSSK